jgi:predicted amidohydrolase
MIRVGYYQFRPRFGDTGGNCRKIVKRLRDVDADLMVLPELPFTGYLFSGRRELAALAEEPRKSPIVGSLVALCRERRMHIVTGFAEKAGDKIFNSALLLGPRGIRHVYRKLHLFNLEKRWFDPGDTPLAVQRVRGARIGMMICFDWVFPEVTRALAVEGMDLLCHPSDLVLDYCQGVMLSRSVENGIFTVTANRFGDDRRPHGRVRFSGKSQITGPRGELIQRAPSQREVLHVEALDPRRARDKKITPGNDLIRDRRPEFY